ncbi:hypothetical protein PPERSA_03881 [Pseudocohnilembus persalinus]|uniref:NAD(P)-binding domain n=1 Tax=Pseudocohnilembus persalinus TaxID=266149 RepID=A0A0V0Q9A2_PSEPJ|nr:hypothetical protein PPERSA_03881 [Pseudocohnilembus persalinus]|eukprot:KRW98746.1 hypothetical protein PPERSA_03881 [Pseudocohnilembus persalinus]
MPSTLLLASTVIAGKFYMQGPTCQIKKDMSGKTVLITGATSGIGKETAKSLAQQNATLILACRNQEKSEKFIQELKKNTGNQNIHFIQLQLDDWSQIKKSVEDLEKLQKKVENNNIDVLINNAGIYVSKFDQNKQGFESQFATNHMGHFIFTNLLFQKLKNTPESRVINLSSRAHERSPNLDLSNYENFEKQVKNKESFSALNTYPLSKLANMMFTKGLQFKFDSELQKINNNDGGQMLQQQQKYQNYNTPTKVVSCHPGVVATEMIEKLATNNEKIKKYVDNFFFKNFILSPVLWYFCKTPEQGAQTTLQLVYSDYSALKKGGYYKDLQLADYHKQADNTNDVNKFWEFSEIIAKPFY